MQKVCYIIIMSKTRNQQPTREDIFRQKAETYTVCFSSTCPNREHCLRSLLRAYTPHDKLVCTSINLNHPMTQQTDCPMYRNDQTVRMAQGFMDIFYDVPGHLEVSIKKHLIATYGRKRYYEYRNGARAITPEVEQYIRDTFLRFGWTAELHFDGFVDEYQW